MPLFHCNDCHHEWEGNKYMTRCGWCNGSSYILEEFTPLEKMLKCDKFWEMIKEMEIK